MLARSRHFWGSVRGSEASACPSDAVVSFASPKKLDYSLKLSLVLTTTLVLCWSLLNRWNISAPPETLNGRYYSNDGEAAHSCC